ncbi:phage tail sheath family protein [Glaciecola sp. SC05]|uniref:phage tail sheath family protein n=1 Tax=Glaciecola sp. SC05 TaxID=1987355 RepID=UPI0035278C83
MSKLKTPGVYIVEKNAFPNSVVEVATAVPAFIGYTQRADKGSETLLNKPWRITSMSDFHTYYGVAPQPLFNIIDSVATNPADSIPQTTFTHADKTYSLKQANTKYLLYYSMLLFFQNGGGACYIVSVGNYEDSIEPAKLKAGIDLLSKEQEPTLVIVPEAVLLSEDECIDVQHASVAHCGGKMRNRMSILDVWGGFKARQDPSGDCIANFRSKLGNHYLNYSAAYYPWLNTSLVQSSDVSFVNVANLDALEGILIKELELEFADLIGLSEQELSRPGKAARLVKQQSQLVVISSLKLEQPTEQKEQVHEMLTLISKVYPEIVKGIQQQLNLLPPAAAMAGVYTMVDNSRGVWAAPANVSLLSVVSPTVNVSHDQQEDLNLGSEGKSINAIRVFTGQGTLVWGARTLDGNSLDWRYINVRRTMIMLEESIKLATKAYVFEPNTENTWVTIASMIRHFLTGVWKQGGLAGSTPEDAFSVSVGLGNTMTNVDILEGILRIRVLVAIARPAEFIEITFQQHMQN